MMGPDGLLAPSTPSEMAVSRAYTFDGAEHELAISLDADGSLVVDSLTVAHKTERTEARNRLCLCEAFISR